MHAHITPNSGTTVAPLPDSPSFDLRNVQPFFGALPPPLDFLSGAPLPPAFGSLGLLTSSFPGLTLSELSFPPASLSAVASADSGLVLSGLNAASELAASWSEPDLEYSFDRGLRESLSCVSFDASLIGVVERKRGVTTAEGRANAARRRTRDGWKRYMARL